MNIQLGDKDLRRLEEMARREGKAVEDLVAQIFQEALHGRERNGTWVDEVSGSFEGDPEFEHVVKLGRKLREAHEPDSGS